MTLVVITHSASPYQVELFDEIQRCGVETHVVYLTRTGPGRTWSQRGIFHRATFIDEGSDASAGACRAVTESDVAIVGCYRHKVARRLISIRARSGRPWAFWGERPGATAWRLLGRAFRLWELRKVHADTSVPIWGIGSVAVGAYRREFGQSRRYVNIPYTSNLRRFGMPGRKPRGKSRTILFSGVFCSRKGIDLLAKAFLEVKRKERNLRLLLAGAGEMFEEIQDLLVPAQSDVELLGFRDWDELPGIYQRADVLCLPSRYDGWGLVVPEGLAASLPVIVSDRVGSAYDLVQDGVNGWVVKSGSVGDLVRALEQFATISNDRLDDMSEKAAASAKEMDIERGAARFIAEASRLLNERSVL